MKYFCPYIDDCNRNNVTEVCYRAYENCKTYQENKCFEEREKELKQLNLEKMIVEHKKAWKAFRKINKN